jgi:hypothetical protein
MGVLYNNQKELEIKTILIAKGANCMSSLNNTSEIKPSSYQSPRIVTLGKTVQLIRQDSTGQLVDGTGGWYVYRS